MIKLLRAAFCLLLAVLLSGCGQKAALPTEATQSPTDATEPAPTEPLVPPTEATEPPDPIEQLLAQMSLRDEVGQLFIVSPEALMPENSYDQRSMTQVTDALRSGLEAYPVGGIIFFAEHITSPTQISDFNAALQEAVTIPLFLAVDEEGGVVARLANHSAFDLPRYPSAAAVGASGNPAAALEMGLTIGGYLKRYGFNMDMAPVADVSTNPYNSVIGNRAFSSAPEVAAVMASSMAEGLRQQSIIPVFKHFPGHGDTAQDSHTGIAVSYQTVEQLERCEWLPFLEAEAGDCVMVGHIALPQVTGDETPATLSYQIVTELLKGRLGFQGLVITDSLQMGAITDTHTSGEAAVAALQAGCDILLMPESLPEAFEAVLTALEDGRLDKEWLDETVRRILEFKQQHGILN